MSKYIRILLIILMAVSAVLGILFYAGGDVPGTDQPEYTNTILVWAAILAGLAMAITIIFPIIQMVSNPKGAKKGLLGIVILAVIVFVSYSLASTDFLKLNESLQKYNEVTTLKQVGAGIYTMYILIGLAILSIVYTEVAKVFK